MERDVTIKSESDAAAHLNEPMKLSIKRADAARNERRASKNKEREDEKIDPNIAKAIERYRNEFPQSISVKTLLKAREDLLSKRGDARGTHPTPEARAEE